MSRFFNVSDTMLINLDHIATLEKSDRAIYVNRGMPNEYTIETYGTYYRNLQDLFESLCISIG